MWRGVVENNPESSVYAFKWPSNTMMGLGADMFWGSTKGALKGAAGFIIGPLGGGISIAAGRIQGLKTGFDKSISDAMGCVQFPMGESS